MSDLLHDYELKRERAAHHFETLRESVEAFVSVDHQPVRGEFDPSSGEYRFEMPLERADPAWALSIGDYAFNTRAALDYLVTALIRSTGETEHDGSQFPIYSPGRVRWEQIDQWWDKDVAGTIRRKLWGTPSGTKAALKKLQPFYGVPRADPLRHPLSALVALSNRDKHRRLNLLARRASVEFIDGAGKPIYDTPTPPLQRITERPGQSTYTVLLNAHAKFDVDVYFHAAYDVVFDEAPELISHLVETLTSIDQYIDTRVIPTVFALL